MHVIQKNSQMLFPVPERYYNRHTVAWNAVTWFEMTSRFQLWVGELHFTKGGRYERHLLVTNWISKQNNEEVNISCVRNLQLIA